MKTNGERFFDSVFSKLVAAPKNRVKQILLKQIIFISIFLLPQILPAQDSVWVTKNFQFEDGIYLSLEEFQRNHPSIRWEQVESNYFVNPQTFLVQLAYLRKKGMERADTLNLKTIWAISIDGIPYLRLQENDIHKELTTFAALRVRGKICYFAYPDSRSKKVKISAYNPLNGLPFRTAELDREEEVLIKKMMRFETGEIKDFTLPDFMGWIEDDPILKSTIEELSAEEAKEKLFKSLLIYDDRNAVYLKSE